MSYINTKIEKYQGVLPKNKFYKFVKMTKGHNIIDVVRMTNEPKCHVKRLCKRTYLNTKTGEVAEYMPKIEGQQFRNIRSLKIIFKNLNQLIETNFQGGASNKFLTLTYEGSKQHSDPKKIYHDLKLFNQKLKRAYPDVGYIHIVEPHASGNFHVHSLIKRMDGEPFEITYQEAYKLWGQGYVTVEELNNVDNLGAYFIAYFSHLEISDEDLHKYQDDIKQMPRQDGNGYKNVIKGKRLDYYPDYMYIYRNSRNLKKPKTIGEIPEEFYKFYESAYKLTSTDENRNTAESYIKKEQHKRKRQQ